MIGVGTITYLIIGKRLKRITWEGVGGVDQSIECVVGIVGGTVVVCFALSIAYFIVSVSKRVNSRDPAVVVGDANISTSKACPLPES